MAQKDLQCTIHNTTDINIVLLLLLLYIIYILIGLITIEMILKGVEGRRKRFPCEAPGGARRDLLRRAVERLGAGERAREGDGRCATVARCQAVSVLEEMQAFEPLKRLESCEKHVKSM